MLSHARGEGSFRGASAGKVESTLTGLYPYGRYATTPNKARESRLYRVTSASRPDTGSRGQNGWV